MLHIWMTNVEQKDKSEIGDRKCLVVIFAVLGRMAKEDFT